ncbi:GLPGLI family protein [Flavobacterium sp. U410]
MKRIMFFLLMSIFMNAQNVFIEYKVTIGKDSLIDKGNPFPKIFEEAKSNAKYLNFGLIVKGETSYFYSIDKMNDLNNSLALSKIIALYNGVIYRDKDNLYQKSDLLGDNIYVKTELNRNWKLEKEIKKIDKYICYKAITEYIVTNPKGKSKHSVTAWYCPEISSQMGPMGYGGLPGLILELQVRNVTYGATKIEVKSEKDFEIIKDKMNIITEEELNKKLEELNGFNLKN